MNDHCTKCDCSLCLNGIVAAAEPALKNALPPSDVPEAVRAVMRSRKRRAAEAWFGLGMPAVGEVERRYGVSKYARFRPSPRNRISARELDRRARRLGL